MARHVHRAVPASSMNGLNASPGLPVTPEAAQLVAQQEALCGEVGATVPRQARFHTELTLLMHEELGVLESAEEEGVDRAAPGQLGVQHRVAQLVGVALSGPGFGHRPAAASPSSEVGHMVRQTWPTAAASASPSCSAKVTSSAGSGLA